MLNDLEHMELHDSWNQDEQEYLNKKLETLIDKCILLDNGCIIHPNSTDKHPIYTLSMKPLNLFPEKKRVSITTHRFVALCNYGPIMLDQMILHNCRTKGCFNYLHISPGTSSQNSIDRFRDGTMGNKLTKEDVLAIYKNKKFSQVKLGELYNIDPSVVCRIQNGYSWSYVTGAKRKVRKVNTREDSCLYILENKQFYLNKIKDNIKITDNECWEWQRTLSKGYGRFTILNYSFMVHITSWSLDNDRFPVENEVVRHKICDNRCCVNPAHLMIGSHSDNMKDMNAFGDNNPSSILTEKEVLEIVVLLKEGTLVEHIALHYGVAPTTISSIKCGNNWTRTTGLSFDNPLKVYKKINPQQISDIKFILKDEKIKHIDISTEYNISKSMISRIYTGKLYKDFQPKLSHEGKVIYDKLKAEKSPKKEKLSLEKVANIKFILKLDKFSQRNIALQYGISRYLISRIQHETSYKNVESKLSEEGKTVLKQLESNYKKAKSREKLTLEEVADIKFILKLDKFNQKDIALQYNIGHRSISGIHCGVSYVAVKPKLSKEGKIILAKLKADYEESTESD